MASNDYLKLCEEAQKKKLKLIKKQEKQIKEIYNDMYLNVSKKLSKVNPNTLSERYLQEFKKVLEKEIKASNKIVKALGERLAMNAPIQGSAADIIKIAMVNVYNRLKDENLESKLILQVHDELIVECKKEESEQVKQVLKESMENATKLSIPLKVEISEANNWYEAK